VRTLSEIARSLPWALLILTVLILALVIVVWVLLRRARRTSPLTEDLDGELTGEPATAAAPEPEEEVVLDLSRGARLRRSFRRGMKRLRSLAADRDQRFQIPWFLLLGQAGSRPPNLLADAQLSLPLGPPSDRELASDLGLSWWFLDHGAVLDLAGEYVLRRDGRSSDTGGWRTFLHLLQQHRPERPLDGVIVTLSCRDLLAGMGDPDLLPQLERRADVLQSKLREAQKELGLLLPVYVLITGCEALPGFSSFVEALPASQRDELFGWSNPYRLDAVFEERWADEAFFQIRRRLQNAQIGIHREPASGREADRVFLFPEHVETLRAPVRTFLRRLFGADAYQSPPILRGLYFCGAKSVETGGTLAPGRPVPIPADELTAGLTAAVPPPRRTYFLRDVFNRKILPEASLALPAGRTLVARNRRVRAAQILLAVSALGLTLGVVSARQRLARREPELQRFVTALNTDLRKAAALPRPGALTCPSPVRIDSTPALDLLGQMADTNLSHYRSLFLPSSWFDPLNRDIETRIVDGFQRVVFPSMRYRLHLQVCDLEEGTGGGSRFWLSSQPAHQPTDPSQTLRPVGHTRELLTLSTYVQDLRELESHIDAYNRLPGTFDLEGLDEMIQYLYGQPLPAGFRQHTTLYRDALEHTQAERFTLDPAVYRGAAGGRAVELSQRLYRTLYGDNVLLQVMQHVGDTLEEIGQARWAGADASQVFRELLTDLRELDIVQRSELEWVFAEDFNLGAEYDRMLTAVGASRFLGPEIQAAVLQDGQTGWLELQSELVQQGSIYTEPFLQRTDATPPSPLPALSESVVVLRQAVEGFLGDFPTDQETRPFFTRVAAGDRLHWDTAPLQKAVDLFEPYQVFERQTLPLFPVDLQTAVDDIARHRLADRIRDLLAEAQELRPVAGVGSSLLRADRLQTEVAGFSAAAALLNQIRGHLRELGADELYEDLSFLTMQQGERLLVELDRLLDARGLYLPREDGFAWWDGESPPVYRAFGVRDAEELKAYLDTQRQAIQELAQQYAKPVLDALDAPDLRWRAPFQVQYWERIFTQLEIYATGKPGNSVELLETFITSDLPGAEVPDCAVAGDGYVGVAAAGSGATTAHRRDFFLDRRRLLRRSLHERCLTVTQGQVLPAWFHIADFFDDRLAGRFPFVDSLGGAFETAADPEDVREVFRRYDRLAPDLLALSENDPVFGGNGAVVHAFLRQMGKVRAFFRPYLDAGEPGLVPGVLPAYDLEVEFRANRPRELGGNQIIEWRLEVENSAVELPDPRPRIRWVFGDRLRLVLRWARDSPRLPLSRGLPVGARVDGGTVVWEHADPWSLISFLQSRRARPEDFRGFEDPDPHTLRFDVLTRPAEDPPQAGWSDNQVEPVRVFLRVRLLAPPDPTATDAAAAAANGAAAGGAAPTATGAQTGAGAAAGEGAEDAGGVLVLPRFPFAAPRLSTRDSKNL